MSEKRFGFNGKENDREWGGQLIQDYGFRLYNPAIGKFLSVDPIASEYPFYSTYHFAGNTPIVATDVDGLEPQVEDGNLKGYLVQKGQGFTQIAKDLNNPATQKKYGYCLERKITWQEIAFVASTYERVVMPELKSGHISQSELSNPWHTAWRSLNMNAGEELELHPPNCPRPGTPEPTRDPFIGQTYSAPVGGAEIGGSAGVVLSGSVDANVFRIPIAPVWGIDRPATFGGAGMGLAGEIGGGTAGSMGGGMLSFTYNGNPDVGHYIGLPNISLTYGGAWGLGAKWTRTTSTDNVSFFMWQVHVMGGYKGEFGVGTGVPGLDGFKVIGLDTRRDSLEDAFKVDSIFNGRVPWAREYLENNTPEQP